MKTHLSLLTLSLLLIASASAQTVTSGVPGFISYQGRVLDSSGAIVGSGTPMNRTATFRVWDHPSNTVEVNLIYSEQQTVTIADGKFSVLIGQGVATTGAQFSFSETSKGPPSSIANAFNGSGRYLGVTVDDGTAAVDNEIAPRQQVVSSAFAFRSKFAETLGTSTASTPSLTVVDGGNIGVGNTDPPALFTISGANSSTSTSNTQLVVTADDVSERLRIGVDSTGTGTGFLQSWKEGTGATNLLLNPNGGNVGIGTTAPLAMLQVGSEGFSWASPKFQVGGGTVSGTQNVPLTLGSFVCRPTGGNQVSLSIKAVKSHGVNGWTGTSVGLTYDVDGVGPAGGELWFKNGNISIGATTTLLPAKLFVHNANSGVDTAVFHSPGVGSNPSHIHYGSDGDIYWRSASVAGRVILQDSGGNVGIGTAVPTVAKLVVNGTAGTEALGSHYTYANTGATAATGSYPSIGGISIKASDAVHAAFFRAISDARIKVIEGVSNGVADLATLSQIEITDYTHKDVIGKGKDRSKKVIAQQVENVFPQAVTKTVDVVPDIYKAAKIVDGWIELPTDLRKGERVRLIGEKHDEIHEVLEVEEDRFLTAYRPVPKTEAKAPESPIADVPSADAPLEDSRSKATEKEAAGKNESAVEADRIFVFGREVKDFRVVDYEAIAMLNVSATQQIKKEKDALQGEVKVLKDENAELKERLTAMDSANQARDAKLAAIEKLLQGTDKPALRTVSLKSAE